MPRTDLTYPKDATNTVKRHNDIASYQLRQIHGIVNAAPLVHVAFVPEGAAFPAVLPMIGQMGSFARPSADVGEVLDLYLHGYVSSRLVNVSRSEKPDKEGLPVTVSASLVDGLVLALSPFAHSYNYRSAVLFGHATLVADPAERLYAMELITDKVVPGRWHSTRQPPTAAELQSTSILRVRIATGSAKIRTGSAHDAPADAEDADVLGRVWAGVVPMAPVLGTPIPAPYNRIPVPADIAQYMADFNADGKEASIEAAVELK